MEKGIIHICQEILTLESIEIEFDLDLYFWFVVGI